MMPFPALAPLVALALGSLATGALDGPPAQERSAPAPRVSDDACYVFARDTVSARLGYEACRHAAARLRELLGVPVPFGALILQPANDWGTKEARALVVPEGAAWVQHWMDVGLYALRPHMEDTTLAARVRQLRDFLPHETAHRMVGALFFPGTDGRETVGYATPLPDWLDDGLAQLAEYPEFVIARPAQLASGWAQRIPLERFVREPHPVLRQRAAMQARLRARQQGAPPPPADTTVPPTGLWYAQAFVLTQFLAERCGRDFHAVVSAFAREPLAWPRLPCTATSAAALAPEFRQWFERRYMRTD